MNIYHFTSLARPIDLNYPTNKAIATLTMIVFGASIILLMATGGVILDSTVESLIAGLIIFLSWTIAREIDPDYELSAFFSAGLSLIGLIFLDIPSLIVLFWILLLARMVNRSTGLPARIFDSFVILTLAGWLTFNGYVVVSWITSVAFLLDSFLSRPQRHQSLFAIITLVISALAFNVYNTVLTDGKLSLLLGLALLAMSSLFFLVIYGSTKISAVGDKTAEVLDPKRVQSAQGIVLSSAVLIAVWNGWPGMSALMPLWAAIVGTALYRFFVFAKASILSTE
jgi:hypothetical protein